MQQPYLSKKASVILVIIAVIALVIWVLMANKPEAKKQRAANGPSVNVETMLIEATTFEPSILSYGLVEPRTRSRLVAQVSGRIEHVSERFRDGGFFEEGDVLLKIDATDYEIDVDVANANLAEAERRYEEEIAQSEQAKEDWLRLGEQSEPSALVLREPQLKSAKANMQSAQASLNRAGVNLSRTIIRAPFDGRVLSTDVDLGQVASNNAVLGEIYATDAIEIRLPIKNVEIPLIALPEAYRDQQEAPRNFPSVDIFSDLAGVEVWQGEIVRTASSIDDASRQLYVVASIDDPFGKKAEGRFPLKIGQYVTAKIEGSSQENSIIIPNKAIYQGSYIYTYKDGAVFRTDIGIQWQDSDIALINSGLNFGDEIVISPLGQITSGTLVNKTNTETISDKPEILNSPEPEPIEQWIKAVSPESLIFMKKRAKDEGRSLEDIATEIRAQKGDSQ